MNKLVNRKSITITKDKCLEIAMMDEVRGDRLLDEKKVKDYHKKIMNGEFSTPLWVVTYCHETGMWYRVNGQHTTNAYLRVFDSTGFLPSNQGAFSEEYESETLQDVANLYSRYDSPSMTRHQNNINRVQASTVLELQGIPDSYLNKVISGISFSKSGGGSYGASNRDEKSRLCHIHKDMMVWYYGVYKHSDAHKQIMRRGPVVATVFEVYELHKENADDLRHVESFWYSVASGKSDWNAPAKWLREYLLHTPAGRNGDPEKLMRAVCVTYWNRFVRGVDGKLARNRYRKECEYQVKLLASNGRRSRRF